MRQEYCNVSEWSSTKTGLDTNAIRSTQSWMWDAPVDYDVLGVVSSLLGVLDNVLLLLLDYSHGRPLFSARHPISHIYFMCLDVILSSD
jgi:hypothetical protein